MHATNVCFTASEKNIGKTAVFVFIGKMFFYSFGVPLSYFTSRPHGIVSHLQALPLGNVDQRTRKATM